MSARCWWRRRNKAARRAKWRARVVVIDIADLRAAAERRSFNEALTWWLDRPHLTYGGIE